MTDNSDTTRHARRLLTTGDGGLDNNEAASDGDEISRNLGLRLNQLALSLLACWTGPSDTV